MNERRVRRTLNDWRFWGIVAFFGLVVAWTGLAVVALQNRTAVRALCYQRSDLDTRIESTHALLHSNGHLLIFGIPRKLIVDGMRQNQKTRENLSILDC